MTFKFEEKGTIVLCCPKSFINGEELKERIEKLKEEYNYETSGIWSGQDELSRKTADYVSEILGIEVKGSIPCPCVDSILSFGAYTYRDLYECLAHMHKTEAGFGRPIHFNDLPTLKEFLFGQNGIVENIDDEISVAFLNYHLTKLKLEKNISRSLSSRIAWIKDERKILNEEGEHITTPEWVSRVRREEANLENYRSMYRILYRNSIILGIDLMYYISQYKKGTREYYNDFFIDYNKIINSSDLKIPDEFLPQKNELKIYCGSLDDVTLLGAHMSYDNRSGSIYVFSNEKINNIANNIIRITQKAGDPGFFSYVYDRLGNKFC